VGIASNGPVFVGGQNWWNKYWQSCFPTGVRPLSEPFKDTVYNRKSFTIENPDMICKDFSVGSWD
jgi:hypothetical protein